VPDARGISDLHIEQEKFMEMHLVKPCSVIRVSVKYCLAFLYLLSWT